MRPFHETPLFRIIIFLCIVDQLLGVVAVVNKLKQVFHQIKYHITRHSTHQHYEKINSENLRTH